MRDANNNIFTFSSQPSFQAEFTFRRSAALCHMAVSGVVIEKTMFPSKQKCFDRWWKW